MTYYRDPQHSESGARGANLKFDTYDSWSLLQSLELRVGKKINVSDCFAILPEFWAGWEHDYLTPNRVSAVLAGDTSRGYSAPVLGIAQDRALLGVGVKTLIRDKYEVSARYDARIWGEGHNQQFNVGFAVKF
jgi:outer membrane autotransporter protein